MKALNGWSWLKKAQWTIALIALVVWACAGSVALAGGSKTSSSSSSSSSSGNGNSNGSSNGNGNSGSTSNGNSGSTGSGNSSGSTGSSNSSSSNSNGNGNSNSGNSGSSAGSSNSSSNGNSGSTGSGNSSGSTGSSNSSSSSSNGNGNSNSGSSGSSNSSGGSSNSSSSNSTGNSNSSSGPQTISGVFHLCIPTQTGCLILSNSTLGMIPTGSSNPTLGIVHTGNSGPTFDNLVLGIFVPSQTPNAFGLNFTVNFGNTSAAATLFSNSAWGTGKLFENYLGAQTAGGGPPTPLSAFLTGTTILQPNTTGYSVYLANLGVVTFPTTNLFTFTLGNLTGFPLGTVIYPWATDVNGVVVETTPQSSAGVVDVAPPPPLRPTPEPSSLVLFGSGLLGLARIVRRRIAGRS